MADITVTCTNDKNVSIAFRWDWDNNPFHLLGLDGIYGYDCNVTTSENTTTDGSTYQGKVIKRTAKTVVVLKDGEEKRCKIGLSWNGKEETITPWGVYSMCPVIGASDIAA